MTLVIAHRGASAYASENTLRAFELAVRQGADMCELDVQRTADGVLVVFHDDESSAKSRNFTNPMPGVEAAGGPGIAMAAPESP